MLRDVKHIFEHFVFSSFPEGEDAKALMGTKFTSNDLILYYKNNYITMSQIWRIINSKSNNKITYNDLKKGW